MAGAERLTRLRDYEVETARKAYAAILARQAAIRAEMDQIHRTLAIESEVCAQTPEAARYFLAYRDRMNRRLERLAADLDKAKQQAEEALDQLTLAFEELKKTEAVAEARALAERREVEKRERLELDEIGIDRARRLAEEETMTMPDLR